MKRDFTILIIDDHPAMAYGTKMLLEEMPGVKVGGIAGTGAQGLELAMRDQPDVIFLDYNLPDLPGYDVAVRLKETVANAHIVIFTGFDLEPMYNSLLRLEISGILSKDAGEEQLRNMIRCLQQGQTALPMELFRRLLLGQSTDNVKAGVSLSADEAHIMDLIVQGSTNEQIADDIHMSKRSVDNYVRKIYEKFGVRTRAQAVEHYLKLRQ